MRFPGGERNGGTRRVGAPGRDRALGLGSPGVDRTERRPPRVRWDRFSVDERVGARSADAAARWGCCGPALPSPTSGGPARFYSSLPARASAAARSAGSGERTSTGAPVTGCGNASRAACRNWRASPWRPGAPYSGSPATGWPMASRCARIWCVRPGLEPHAQQRVVRERALDLEVRDRLARVVGVRGDPGADAPVAAQRRVDRAAPRRRPALDEGEVLAHEVARARARP